MDAGSMPFLRGFFGNGLHETGDPLYSHLVRWRSTARHKRFFSQHVKATLSGYDGMRELADGLDARMANWDWMGKAQYLEAKIFLAQYLLSSQGDRMAMAHAVEGRFPFLDHRVVEFAAKLPTSLKLRGLNEKYLLKRAVGDLLPATITERTKQPYRAPISTSFFGDHAPAWVADVLSAGEIRAAGLFDPAAVAKLVQKCSSGSPVSEGDNMALVGVLSTQLIDRQFRADWVNEARRRADQTPPVLVEASDVLALPA